MYHFINSITHTDQLISDKVNFFADYFEIVSSNIGKLNSAELENHKSILEKILTHLVNHTSKSNKHIKRHLSHRYLSSKDSIIQEYYLQDWKVFIKSRELYLKKNDVNGFIKAVNIFLKKLEIDFFQNILNNIITAIECKHPLHKHRHIEIFEYNTPLLVSEFILSGFNGKELGGLFRRIFESEIRFDDNKVQTRAPLPLELVELKQYPERFFEEASRYLKSRTLKQQFEGIYLLFRSAIRHRTIIFSIQGIEAYDPIVLNYNRVTFSNQLWKEYVKKESREEFNSFFTGQERVFARVTVITGDTSSAVKLAIREIRLALNYLNSILKSNAQILDNDYVISEEGACYRQSAFSRVIHKSSYGSFENNNNELYLIGVETELAKRIILLDKIYFQAQGYSEDEVKLVNLWRYLESFFDFGDYEADQVKTNISKILSHHSVESYTELNLNLALKLWNNYLFNQKQSSLKREELRILIESCDFQGMKEIIMHPYITRQLTWQVITPNSEKIKKSFEFYYQHLTEVYEQRNLVEHSGVYNEAALKKVMLTFPDVVKKFRKIVSEKAKSDVIKSFIELLNSYDSKTA